MSTGIFIPMTKCVHEIPYHGCTHETNSSSSSSLASVYWRHYKQQLELELQGPLPLLFMNQQCVGSLMSSTECLYTGMMVIMIYKYILSLMARRLESLTMHLRAAVIKKVALSSQLRIFSFPACTYYFSCIKKL